MPVFLDFMATLQPFAFFTLKYWLEISPYQFLEIFLIISYRYIELHCVDKLHSLSTTLLCVSIYKQYCNEWPVHMYFGFVGSVSSGQIPRSGIAGSKGKQICGLVRYCWIHSPKVWTIFHSHQQYMRVAASHSLVNRMCCHTCSFCCSDGWEMASQLSFHWHFSFLG